MQSFTKSRNVQEVWIVLDEQEEEEEEQQQQQQQFEALLALGV